MITQEYLHQLFEYKDGNLYWKVDRFKGVNKTTHNKSIDQPAGSSDKKNSDKAYMRICIDQKRYFTHRLVFLYHHGYTPKYIDHINGNRKDNRIENLRPATRQQNMWNKPGTSSTGYKNIHYRGNGIWRVIFYVDGNNKTYGNFRSLEEAVEVAEKVRTELHGEFANSKTV